MISKIEKKFVASAAILLLVTGLSKIISAFGHAHILELEDPILRLPHKTVFLAVGSYEFAVAMFCLCQIGSRFSLKLIAWTATSISIYRLGLYVGHYQQPCSCMGNMTEALHISSQTADVIMKTILAYLLFCSYYFLARNWMKTFGVSARIEESC
jgi:hypothetical protein